MKRDILVYPTSVGYKEDTWHWAIHLCIWLSNCCSWWLHSTVILKLFTAATLRLSSVSDANRPPRRLFPLPNCHSQGLNFCTLLPLPLAIQLKGVPLLFHHVVLFYGRCSRPRTKETATPCQHIFDGSHILWQRQLLKGVEKHQMHLEIFWASCVQHGQPCIFQRQFSL